MLVADGGMAGRTGRKSLMFFSQEMTGRETFFILRFCYELTDVLRTATGCPASISVKVSFKFCAGKS